VLFSVKGKQNVLKLSALEWSTKTKHERKPKITGTTPYMACVNHGVVCLKETDTFSTIFIATDATLVKVNYYSCVLLKLNLVQ